MSTLRHQLGLGAFEADLIARIVELLEDADADVVSRIQRRFDPDSLSTARLNALLVSIREATTEAYSRIRETLTDELQELAASEAAWAGSALAAELPIEFSAVALSREQLRAVVVDLPLVGNTLGEELSAQTAARFKRIAGVLRLGIVEGRTNAEIVRDVVGTRAEGFTDGILTISRRQASALVRTATSHTANAARLELYRANGDIVKAVMVSATLDGRTTLVCAERDGEIYYFDKLFPVPPFHWNCRTTLTPVTKTLREMGLSGEELTAGERASMDGPLPSKLTFSEFLRLKDQKNPAFVVAWFAQTFGAGAETKLASFRAGGSL